MDQGSNKLPQGFRAAGVTCGIKESGHPDLAVWVSDCDATAAGVFTQNQVCGAPVVVSRARLPSSNMRGVVINSGNANACTGEQGVRDAHFMAQCLANQLSVAPEQSLVCSTGVIGHFLPMAKITSGIEKAMSQLGETTDHLRAAAQAMMTTDTVSKVVSRTVECAGRTFTITGFAKGAAMIAPNMATMLAVILTDASLTPQRAQQQLKSAVDQSFNCISVEGHTSTSDSVLLLANGMSGVSIADSEAELFQEALNRVTADLAQKIIRDAEGAEHFVTVNVSGLSDESDARRIAKVVCESPLVKTAMTGNDPNWGRIVSAAGYAGVTFREDQLSLRLNGVLIYECGSPLAYDEAALSSSMATGEVIIDLQFTLGSAEVTYWTCDLTSEYIRLNADYTT